MKHIPSTVPAGYPRLLEEIKTRIRQAQTRAIFAANAELVSLYWDIGRLIGQRQRRAGWGAAVIPRLSRELRNELPELKGFSERNIKLMVQFAREYPDAFVPSPSIGQPAVAQLATITNGQQLVAQIPWAHNVLLMQRLKEPVARLWYMQQTLANGWSRNVLLAKTQSRAHGRQGTAVTNFEQRLPAPPDLARQTLKDPYVFDFLTLEEPFRERELETNLLHQLERFLLELGQGLAFVGRQLHLEVGGNEFYIDLLFYHLKLRCFVVIDLKKGEFKPEYTGKMNFYLSVVDDQLRHDADAPSVGLILCQNRNHVVAEYALRGVTKPIGISEYELTRTLPSSLQSALPTVDEIEAELTAPDLAPADSPKRRKPKAVQLGMKKSQRRESKHDRR
jgi:predicted nuclease of restriction endonuclease-like (RecB) superfamily